MSTHGWRPWLHNFIFSKITISYLFIFVRAHTQVKSIVHSKEENHKTCHSDDHMAHMVTLPRCGSHFCCIFIKKINLTVNKLFNYKLIDVVLHSFRRLKWSYVSPLSRPKVLYMLLLGGQRSTNACNQKSLLAARVV